MRRPTRAEIDAEILDCAAGVFGRHGFARASIQQIADALKYSKAGLLHHYPSKKALFDAVVDRYEKMTRERIAKLGDFAPGIDRDRALVENVVDSTFEFPGMSTFAQQLAREGELLASEGGERDPRFTALGLEVVASLGVDLADPDLDRLARAFTALAGANFSARLAVTMGLQREWRAPIIAAAMAALGHGSHDAAP